MSLSSRMNNGKDREMSEREKGEGKIEGEKKTTLTMM